MAANSLILGKSRLDRTQTVEVRVDPYSGSMTTMNSEHSAIHVGDGYNVSGKINTIGTGTSVYFYIDPGEVIHLRDITIIATNNPVDVILSENPTVDPIGTTLNIYNRNRLSTNVSGTVVTSGPTVSDEGTPIFQDLITGGKDTGGTIPSFPAEWIIDGGNTYLVKVTNNSGATINITYNFFWYELNI